MKKKTFSKLLTSIALCAAVLTMAACGNEQPKESIGGADVNSGGESEERTAGGDAGVPAGEAAEVPTEDGKITFYFTLDETSVEQPDIASYFLTGGSFGWATGLEALTFAQMDESNVYYAMTDVVPDASIDQGLDYQLKVGYNETSGAPANELGLTWSDDELKSDQCNMGGESNPQFAYEAGQNTVNLGVHRFSKEIPTPQAVDTTLRITFAQPLPDGCEARIFGGFNSWSAEEDGMCRFDISTDRLSGELALKGVLLNTYQYKVVVYAPDEFAAKGQWGGTSFVDTVISEDGNGEFVVGTLDGGDYIEVVTDIVYEIPSGIDITLSVTFDKALEEGAIVHMYGSFQGWGYSEGNCEMTSEDGMTWTIPVNNVVPGTQEFKVLVYAPDTAEFGWGLGIEYGAEGGNCVVEVTEENAGQVIPAAEFIAAE